jgi:hypothetical protein
MDDIKKIESSREIESKKNPNVIQVGFKGLLVFSKKASIFFSNVILKNAKQFFSFCQRQINTFTRYRKNKEVKINNYLSNVEKELTLQEITQKHKKEVSEKLKRKMTSDLNKIFDLKNFTINYKSQLDKDNHRESIDFDLKMFEQIYSKMTESQLIANLFALHIDADLSNGKVFYQLNFELQNNGLKWATLYTKFVMKSIQENLKSCDGHYFIELKNNVTLGRENLFVVIEHQILDQTLNTGKLVTPKMSNKTRSLSDLGI